MYLFNYQACWKIRCLIAIVVSSGRTSIQISSQLCLVYVRAQFQHHFYLLSSLTNSVTHHIISYRLDLLRRHSSNVQQRRTIQQIEQNKKKIINLDRNRFVVYAGDILLISPSVVNLENLIHLCERELNWLDMAINYKKILLFTYRTTM